jgi:hypothetical protein|uniref:Uncharacterized protein n=1 Tax=viral metagenome TaxID=1070528 RepID=A0A6C0CJI9_9ZZZZ
MSTPTSESAFTSTQNNLESQKQRALQYSQQMKNTQDTNLQQRYKQGAVQALKARKTTRDIFSNTYKSLAVTKAIETCPCYTSANQQLIQFIKDKKSLGSFNEENRQAALNLAKQICDCYFEGKKAMEDYIKKSEELLAQHSSQKAGKTRRKKSKKPSRRKKRRTKNKK